MVCRSIPLLLVIGLSLASLSVGAADAPDVSRLKKLRGEIETLQNTLKSDKKEKSQIFLELRQADLQINVISRALRTTGKELKKQQRAHDRIRAETRDLKYQLDQQREQLSQFMRAGYSAGQQPALKLLLNQSDPAEVGRTLTYYHYLTEAQLEVIKETRQAVDRLSAAEEALRQQTRKLEQVQLAQQTQYQSLLDTKQARKEVLAQLEQRIKTKEQKLQQLIENERRLARLLKDLEQRAEAERFQGRSLGSLKNQLQWPAKGKILHRFGSFRHQGGLRWQGVKIGAREGEDVYAIAPGKVIFADWLRGYGLTLIIDHGEGYMSIYSHNQGLYKDRGDHVDARELIAEVGSSGGNSEPGLYFEIRHKGKPVNPARWCR